MAVSKKDIMRLQRIPLNTGSMESILATTQPQINENDDLEDSLCETISEESYSISEPLSTLKPHLESQQTNERISHNPTQVANEANVCLGNPIIAYLSFIFSDQTISHEGGSIKTHLNISRYLSEKSHRSARIS